MYLPAKPGVAGVQLGEIMANLSYSSTSEGATGTTFWYPGFGDLACILALARWRRFHLESNAYIQGFSLNACKETASLLAERIGEVLAFHFANVCRLDREVSRGDEGIST